MEERDAKQHHFSGDPLLSETNSDRFLVGEAKSFSFGAYQDIFLKEIGLK